MILSGICIAGFIRPKTKSTIKKPIKKRLSIIIVNWNCKEYIRSCLKSVFKNIDNKTEVLVVDNCSEDGSAEIVEKEFPKAKLIRNNKNLGFSKANNQGIDISEGKYVLTLNPDVILTEGYANELIKIAEHDPKIGAVTGKLLNMKKHELIDSVGHVMYLIRAAQDKGSMHIDTNQFKDGPVFGVCAAAALYKKEMLDDIKIDNEYFDEDFFAYYEDVDLNWHANLMGWKSYFVSNAIAYHARGVTTNSDSKLFLSFKNRYFSILKNDFLISLLKSCFIIILENSLHQSAYFKIFVKSTVEFYKSYFKMLAKRKYIHDNRRISRKEIEKKFKDNAEFIKEQTFLKKIQDKLNKDKKESIKKLIE